MIIKFKYVPAIEMTGNFEERKGWMEKIITVKKN